jgi:hypothetical protein
MSTKLTKLSPSSVALSGASAATATVTAATAGNSAALTSANGEPPSNRPFGPWSGLSGTLRLTMVLGFVSYRRERRSRVLLGLALLSLLALASTMLACGAEANPAG